MPKIDIIMPVYNVSPYLLQAIKSVQNQTIQNWRLILVDDHSTDKTLQIAYEIASKDKRIEVYENKSNIGPSANLNKALSFCRSPYFTKLDGDDWLHPTSLEKSLNIISKDLKIAIVFSRFQHIDKHGNPLGPPDRYPDAVRNKKYKCRQWVQSGLANLVGSYFYPSYSNYFQAYGLVRKSVIDKYKPFSEWDNEYDVEMWFRIGASHYFYGIDEPLYYYRKNEESITQQVNKNQQSFFYKLLMNKSILKYYLDNKYIDKANYLSQYNNLHVEYFSHLSYQARKNDYWLNAVWYYILKFYYQAINRVQ